MIAEHALLNMIILDMENVGLNVITRTMGKDHMIIFCMVVRKNLNVFLSGVHWLLANKQLDKQPEIDN